MRHGPLRVVGNSLNIFTCLNSSLFVQRSVFAELSRLPCVLCNRQSFIKNATLDGRSEGYVSSFWDGESNGSWPVVTRILTEALWVGICLFEARLRLLSPNGFDATTVTLYWLNTTHLAPFTIHIAPKDGKRSLVCLIANQDQLRWLQFSESGTVFRLICATHRRHCRRSHDRLKLVYLVVSVNWRSQRICDYAWCLHYHTS